MSIRFNVFNRFSGLVQFTAEIECDENAATGVKLGMAVKWAHSSGANLSGAYLGGADLSRADLSRAYLGGANLSGAYLGGAYLGGAYLGGADLSRADLSRAYLGGADLSGADLGGAYLGAHKLAEGNSFATLGTPDNWAAFTFLTDGNEQRVCVGCRNFTIAEGREHWTGKPDRQEVLAALDYAEAIARIRGWGTVVAQQAAE